MSASVDYATADGTATVADNDYQANSGTLNFAASETTKQITVLVNGDTTFETDESSRSISPERVTRRSAQRTARARS